MLKTEVIRASYKASTPVAFNDWEFIFLEIFIFKSPIKIFIIIEIIKIENKGQLKEVVSLLNIFSIDDFIKENPTKIIKKDTIREEMY